MVPVSVPEAASASRSQDLWRVARRPFRVLVGLFGAIWIANAGFQIWAWLAQPGGQGAANLVRAFAKPAGGSPSWLKPYILAVAHGVQQIGPHAVAVAMIVIACLIGLAFLFRIGVTAAVGLGLAYCFFCWTTLDSLGYPYAGGQTDPGVFVAYIVSFVFILSVLPVLTENRPGSTPFPNRMWTLGRILFGLLWAFDAALKWQPGFMFHFMDQLTSVVPGQPGWIAAWLGFVIAIVRAVGPLFVAVVVALIESTIALSLLTGRALRLFVPLGFLWSLAIWSTAETFGGPYTSTGTGVRGNVIGNVFIYAVIFLFLWASMGFGNPLRRTKPNSDAA